MRNITALLFVATVPDSGPERLLREQKRVAESITNTARSPSEKSVRDVTHQLLRDLCPDRKSTRLNSSHTVISYAVFCLKKKKKNNANQIETINATNK